MWHIAGALAGVTVLVMRARGRCGQLALQSAALAATGGGGERAPVASKCLRRASACGARDRWRVSKRWSSGHGWCRVWRWPVLMQAQGISSVETLSRAGVGADVCGAAHVGGVQRRRAARGDGRGEGDSASGVEAVCVLSRVRRAAVHSNAMGGGGGDGGGGGGGGGTLMRTVTRSIGAQEEHAPAAAE